MAVELATAYVSVIPSTRGMKGQLTKQMAGPATAAGGRAGGAMAGGIMGSMKRMAPAVGALLAGAGVVKFAGEVGGVASQATRTEASLSALYEAAGHGADEATSATSKLWSEFSRSSIPMKAFQGGAESLAYLGLNAEESVGVMSFLEDAILATGGSSQEMERVTQGLTNAMNRNKATNQELQQISGAGVPIYDMLAAQLGVTTGAVEEMASKGEISVDDLTTALQEGPGQWAPALRAGADEVRSTLPVAWESTKNTIVNAIAKNIVPIVERLAPVMVNVAEGIASATEWMGGAFEALSGWVSGFGESTASTSSWLVETWFQIRETFQSAFDAISAIVAWGVDIVQNFWDRFGVHILSFIQTTWENIKQVFSGAFSIIQGIFEVFAGIFTGDWSRVWDGIKQILGGVWDVIAGIVKQAINVVKTTIGAVMAAISQLWEAIWNTVKTVVSNVWDGIKSLVSSAVDSVVGFVTDLRDRAVSLVSNLRDRVVQFFRNLKADAIRLVGELVTGYVNLMLNLRDRAVNAVTALRDRVVSIFTGLKDRVVDTIGNLMDRVRGIKDSVLGFFSGAKDWLLQAGKNIIQGLIDGIKNMIPDVGGMMNSVVSSVRDRLPFSPAKKGPLAGRGAPDIAGAKIVSMLAEGMGGELGGLASMADRAAAAALPSVGVPSVGAVHAASVSSSGGSGPSTVVLQVGDREFVGFMREQADVVVAGRDRRLLSEVAAGAGA